VKKWLKTTNFKSFSGLGLGPIVAIEETLNSESYIELLKEHLIPEIRAVGDNVVFMQDWLFIEQGHPLYTGSTGGLYLGITTIRGF
jgi:hypothetical protein